MRSQIKLGRIAGIGIGLHYSWFIIAVLIALSLAAHFHVVRPDWNDTVVWGAAIITALLFFVTLLLHELAHSVLAKARGLRVREITLFALGGVSQIESEAPDAKSEFWIGIVGPLTSLAIGAICIAISRASGAAANAEPANPVTAVLLWLGYINLALAAFNMIPGYPLDGGRVLRSIAWWITGNMERATRIAARVGQVVALLLIFYGIYRFFVGHNFGGLWLAFIGWFLLDASRSSYLQVGLMAGLKDRRVADLMERDCARVEGYLSLRDFVDEYLLHSANRCFLVAQGPIALGLITPAELKKVPRDRWDQSSVQSVMRPLNQLRSVSPEMPALQALELMAREHVFQLAVVANGKLQGIFSRDQVLRFLQLHAGFGAEPPAKMAA
ncbi:MAG TPA: site-2 protease family protein [Terriglobales bacterium]|nr:site-2 protease family protein [Terriglobales bacterium]